MPPADSPPPGHAPQFLTTRWSVVVAAGQAESAAASEALATLCRAYWYPLYSFARRRGCDPDEAADRIQGFFLQALERGTFAVADRERGRFRSFLLAALGHYLANARRAERAEKRGGGRVELGLDFAAGEERYRLEPAHDDTPERLFERRWALTVLEEAQRRLAAEQADEGGSAFARLRPYLGGGGDLPYAQLAAELGSSEGALKVRVHRLRRRLRELLRDEVAQTVARPADVDDELRHLLGLFAG